MKIIRYMPPERIVRPKTPPSPQATSIRLGDLRARIDAYCYAHPGTTLTDVVHTSLRRFLGDAGF